MGFNRSVSGKAVWANRKVLQGGGNGGIINTGMKRSGKNAGSFSILPERMTKKHIREVAKKYGFSLKGLTIGIDHNEELLKFPYAGEAIPEGIGTIIFFPNAFRSEEELLRTLVHESEHVGQYKKYGAEYVQNNRDYFEQLAYRAEEDYIAKLKKEERL